MTGARRRAPKSRVIVFVVCYALDDAWTAVTIWRVRREAGHAT